MNLKKNAVAIRVSREMALMCGMVDPTPEEAAEQAERMRDYRARYAEAWRTYLSSAVALMQIGDPLVRTLLDLHEPTQVEYPKCRGCDGEGYEAEDPDWPCRTTRAIADHYGIPLPDMTIDGPP